MKAITNNLLSEVEREAVVGMRHAMHREPELSNNEWKTQKRIIETLAGFGLNEAKTFHKTGVYIDIQGSASGANRSIALRGDIDALPIEEAREDLSYRSQVPGVMHACGHDMHGSIALGTALAFHRMRDRFSGMVRVFFQPAEEEEPLGGRSVAEGNLLDGFDAAVGFHVRTDIPVGSYGARAGAVTNSSDQFTLVVQGTMAHGAKPHLGVDTIAIAAAFINEVQKVVSREMPVDDRVIVTIGTIHGGDARNIICPEVTLEGTIRTASPERRAQLVRRVREVAEGVATMHRGSAEFRSQFGDPPVINDHAMVEQFRRLVCQSVGDGKYIEGSASTGSDDFGFYSSCVPSIYFWFGSKEPGYEAGVHTSTFGVSDKVLIPTTELAIQYCWDLLHPSSS
ncbi:MULTISPECIES: M20 family metallopeptidase [unclassified Mesorhizobium]|uniref:M20 family metallopeptidase n=1 Tax=unclassified Mesorhizobium TaxID=325217 RepID=UPI0004CEDFE9|nr:MULTISPECIES: M20 family metallopeptidase [unclassified Mesorhizobium]WJI74759.1 M20 family metallopeptidase [Mesorhizobium sp. C395A]